MTSSSSSYSRGRSNDILSKQVEQEAARRRYLEHLMGVNFTEGNSIRPLNNGDEIFPRMLEAISAAKSSVNMLTYIYWEGRIAESFADALSARAREGVKVRILLDAIGSKAIDSRLISEMQSGGVHIEWFRPVGWQIWNSDNRTHRKILVCDDILGFTGGVGIAAEWEGDARNPEEWRDMHFELRGPCVAGIAGAFWGNWLEMVAEPPKFSPSIPQLTASGTSAVQVLRSSSVPGGSDAAVLMLGLIELAEHRIDMITPYLVLDDTFLEIIRQKAEAGVSIRLLIPGKHIDKRFERVESERYFESLLSAGVEIFRYQPTMIHTKLLLIDRDLAAIGSMNLNNRSIRKDEEVLVVAQDTDLVVKLNNTLEGDLRYSKQVHPGCWDVKSPIRNGLRLLMRPFRTQL